MRPTILALVFLCAAAPLVRAATAAPAPDAKTAAAPDAKAATAPTAPAGRPALPPNYSVDMTVHADGQDFKMTRWTNENGDMRMDIASPDHGNMTMIQINDDKKTMYMVMPEKKEVMKQSMQHAMDMAGDKVKKPEAAPEAASTEQGTVELVGHEEVNGVSADKYKVTAEGMNGFVWIDPKTQLLARLQADNGTVDFSNYKMGATTAEALVPPKEYKLTDVDEMTAKMGGMGGMGGVGGMLGGMGRGMLGGMGAGMGGNMGGAAGGALGGMIGGPLGRMAGQFLGQKIGAKLGGKVAGGGASKP